MVKQTNMQHKQANPNERSNTKRTQASEPNQTNPT